MKKLTALLIVVLAAAAPLSAVIDSRDAVPAATLLLPYFEVDIANLNAPSTVFTVGNATAAATLAHVTLWTDRGVPTYSLDLYLSGYDVAEVDLRLLFDGIVPQTGPGGSPTCAAVLPPGKLPAATVTGLRNAHSGQSSSLLGNQCGGTNYGDTKVRGYVTIDSTRACTTLFPGDPGYFLAGGTGIATDDNVLWGDYTFYDRASNFAYSDNLVHIEASATDPLTTTAGKYTFYGRRVSGSAIDNREGLPTTWAVRYTKSAPFDSTLALVWRDPGAATAFACGSPPSGLTTLPIAFFNEQEQVGTIATNAFSKATQSVNLANPAQIVTPFSSGWVRYNLQLTASSAPFGTVNQAFVTHVFRRGGQYAGQFAASAQDNINQPDFFSSSFSSVPFNQCSDGIDNDGDGFIDFPADPGCFDASSSSIENPQCSDGVDNDGDGLIDAADPQCLNAKDPSEFQAQQCYDGIDNDLDGQIDFPNDTGCSSLSDTTEALGQCSDGIDNDGDGKIDFGSGPTNDPGCASPSAIENPQCFDGIENEPPASPSSDGLIDFPADPGCATQFSNTESPACNDGVDNDADGLIDFPADPGCASASSNTEKPQCNDGIDNDGDGQIDLADPGCVSSSSNDEQPPCRDGIDNDGDGLIDFPNETGCSSPNDSSELPDCRDGADNDLDNKVDFPADAGCASLNDLNELAGTTTRQCSDGVDNDGDGLVDFPADPGCTSRYDDTEFNP